jgi:hypothetical protein
MTTTLTSMLLAAIVSAPPAHIPHPASPTWTVRVTSYCPHGPGDRGKLNGRWADGPGGGPVAAWTNQTLYGYHCAVSPGTIPLGTKLWIGAPVNRMLLAVDTGGAVNGLHVDVCVPDALEFLRRQDIRGRSHVWRLGWMNQKQARQWRPRSVVR